MLLLAVIGTTGSVPESRYLGLVADLSTMKADLERVREGRRVLEQEVKHLEGAAGTITDRGKAVLMSQERLRHGRDEVKDALEQLAGVLDRHLVQLQGRHDALRVQYRTRQQEIDRLEHMVVLCQRTLGRGPRASHLAADAPFPTLPLVGR